jgi:hypothetical protein
MPPQRDATTDILVAELRQTIVDLRADRDHWRADSDHWRAAFENTQRLLPAPAQPRATIDHADSSLVRVWRWMRKSA